MNISIEEKAKRVKYIRALERFAKSAINLLKRDDFDKEMFEKRVSKNLEILKRAEPVYLDQPYTKGLEEFVNSITNLKEQDELIKEANLLDKLRNNKSYKKDKHKKSGFADEY
ncbi:Uncharacterised protein [Campylobacter geochelonis]|nr:Uncharacterised protein [Campylobacter geochelonis]